MVAAWFAARGDRVTAIEPTREMREGAMALHPSPDITWADDGLPELASVRGRCFDVVWMSAVWMHFNAEERTAMFPAVAVLIARNGALMISLRHGPIPEGRRMFEVGGEETIALAATSGLAIAARTSGCAATSATASSALAQAPSDPAASAMANAASAYEPVRADRRSGGAVRAARDW